MPTIEKFVDRIVQNVERVIIGKRESIQLLLVAMLCDGHVLIEDVPGPSAKRCDRSLHL
jgi:MoxR-like ATPase